MADLLAELQQKQQQVVTPQPVQPTAPTDQTQPTANLLGELQQTGVQTARQQALQQLAQDLSPVEAAIIGTGRGLLTVGRGTERLAQEVTEAPGGRLLQATPLGPVVRALRDIPGVRSETPVEREAFAALEEARPIATTIGQVAGEAAPFLPAGLANVPRSLAGRLAAAFGLGATETGIVAAGRDQAVPETALVGGTIASAAELVLPIFGRVASRTLQRLGRKADNVLDETGNLTDEARRLLDDAGVTEEQLQDEAVKIVREASGTPEGLNRLRSGLQASETPEQAARASLFEDLGIPTTRSRIEQTSDAFQQERRLARQVDSKQADALRERLAEESQAFADVSTALADDLGFPKEAGESIKNALINRRTAEKQKVTDAYRELGELSQGRGIPLSGQNIFQELQDDQTRGLIGRLRQSEIDELNDRFVEFGLDTDPERVQSFVSKRQSQAGILPTKTEITPLNVLNFEEFRKSLNNLSGPDKSPELNAVINRLKQGLDKEINQLDQALKGDVGVAGQLSRDAIEAAKRARNANRVFAGEFGSDKVIDVLIRRKRGSFDEPQLLASQVSDRILSGRGELSAPESVEKITASLIRGGPQGAQALGDLQAAVVMDLLNSATKARSGKLDGGVIDWSGVNFTKRMDQLGDRKLQAIFQNNPTAYNMLKKLQAAGDLKTGFSNVTRASGTADDLQNFLERTPFFRRMFGAAGVEGELLGAAAERGASEVKKRQIRKQVQKAVNTSPVLQKQLQTHRLLYPQILAILGVESITSEEQE